jgi:hypothetical protein
VASEVRHAVVFADGEGRTLVEQFASELDAPGRGRRAGCWRCSARGQRSRGPPTASRPIGRPSLIEAHALREGGRVTATRVGGAARAVAV